MASKNRLPAPTHVQSVVEWRYSNAHKYWDDCGKTILAIEHAFPGLICESLDGGKDGFRFSGRASGITAATFFWNRATVTQTDVGDSQLPASAERFWKVLKEQLAIGAISRLGHRTWVVYRTDSAKEAEWWLTKRSIWNFSSGDEDLGKPQPNGIVLRTTRDDRRLRYEIGAGTITKRNPQASVHGVIVDVDIVVDGPSELIENTLQVLDWNVRFLNETIDPMMRRK